MALYTSVIYVEDNYYDSPAMNPDQNRMWPNWMQAFESFEAPEREPTGTSIADADSVPGEDGRTDVPRL